MKISMKTKSKHKRKYTLKCMTWKKKKKKRDESSMNFHSQRGEIDNHNKNARP